MSSWQRILIRHSGRWQGSEYVNGDTVAVFMAVDQIGRDRLMHQIRDAMCRPSSADLLVFYLMASTDGERLKVSLQSDTDLFRLLYEQKENPVVYVNVREEFSLTNVNVNVGDNMPHSPEGETDASYEEPDASDEDEEANHRADLLQSLKTEFFAWIRQPAQMLRILGQRNFSSDYQASREEHTEGDGVERIQRNWIIPIPEFDRVPTLGWEEVLAPDIGRLVKGALFLTKNELIVIVGIYHMENRVEYATQRSSNTRLAFVCKHSETCTFKIRAKKGESIWRITNLTLAHSCYTDLDRRVERQVTAKVAANYFARRLVDEGCVLRPKEMIAEMLRLYGIKMLYSLALRTRNLAIDMTYGDFEKSYQRIPSYLYLLRERNPGTIYDYQTTHDDVFLHMFVALGQCIRAFESSLRPIIVVDGTHLKGRNRGVLFVAVAKDGNEQIFPLAIGLGPIENDESWTWFLSNLRRCYNPPEGLMIVSDQHKSIENAIKSVYPNTAHGLCYHHLHKNLTRIGKEALIHFKNAAYAYRVEGFEKFFSELELQSHSTHTRLFHIGVERWARSKSPVPRYSFMTSNAAEVLNSRLLWARRLPVSSLLETFRTIMEKWFDERRASAISRQHELTEETYNKLAVQVELSHHLRVRETTTHVYKVEEENRTHQVDLVSRTCECREFDEDKIPCRHAVAAIRRAGLNVYDFVSGYFKTSNLIETYAAPIKAIPHPDEWNVPSEISSIVIQPPAHIRQAGRPSMSRARTAFEDESIRRRRQVCGRCQRTGHNRRVCTAPTPISGVDLNDPTEESDGDQGNGRCRRPKKCSVCRSLEHNKSKCPMRTDRDN